MYIELTKFAAYIAKMQNSIPVYPILKYCNIVEQKYAKTLAIPHALKTKPWIVVKYVFPYVYDTKDGRHANAEPYVALQRMIIIGIA